MYESKIMMNANAICPYFLRENRKKIICEGIEDDSILTNSFLEDREKQYFAKRYCLKNYKECPLAIAIDSKYGSEGVTVDAREDKVYL